MHDTFYVLTRKPLQKVISAAAKPESLSTESFLLVVSRDRRRFARPPLGSAWLHHTNTIYSLK